MPGLHAELPGRPECTGRLERLASQVLRTDRSEFRKERHTGCRTECWWLPGLGSERHTGLRWALPESAQALQVPGRLPYTDQRLASEQPLRTGRRPVPECRSGPYCAVAAGGMPGAWGVAVAGCRIVEACAGWIGLLGHEHNEHDRRGQACDETDDQQEYAGYASRARSATDYGNGAKSRHDEADAQQNATDEVNRVEDDQRGAGLVGVVQAANGKRKGWNNRCQYPNGVDEILHSIGCIAADDGAQQREDDGKRDLDDECAQNPPPEFAAGGAALERGVLFPEADERLADGAVVGRLVERSGQCEEAAGPLWLRLRCAILRLLVVSGRIVVLRRAVLRCLLAVIGCAVLRCLLAVIILTVGAVTAILLGLLRVLRIILAGVRH